MTLLAAVEAAQAEYYQRWSASDVISNAPMMYDSMARVGDACLFSARRWTRAALNSLFRPAQKTRFTALLYFARWRHVVL